MDLLNQKCVPCEGEAEPMTRVDAEAMLAHNVRDWSLDASAKQISKKFKFQDFKAALKFVNKVGEIAENDGHHPDLHLTDYNQVSVVLSTHAIKGLSPNDFIVAAKINNLK